MRPLAFARFWSKVRVGDPDQCWPYQGGLDHDGYGIFNDLPRHSVRAHRFAFKCANGRDAVPMALHRCNNRSCCNPLHLKEGTGKDNSDDCFAAGNYKTVFVEGEDHPNAKLTNAQVQQALALIDMGHKQVDVAARFGVHPTAIAYHRTKRRRSKRR